MAIVLCGHGAGQTGHGLADAVMGIILGKPEGPLMVVMGLRWGIHCPWACASGAEAGKHCPD